MAGITKILALWLITIAAFLSFSSGMPLSSVFEVPVACNKTHAAEAHAPCLAFAASRSTATIRVGSSPSAASKTIQGGVGLVPDGATARWTIEVEPGAYPLVCLPQFECLSVHLCTTSVHSWSACLFIYAYLSAVVLPVCSFMCICPRQVSTTSAFVSTKPRGL